MPFDQVEKMVEALHNVIRRAVFFGKTVMVGETTAEGDSKQTLYYTIESAPYA
jgi:hypothetical protein